MTRSTSEHLHDIIDAAEEAIALRPSSREEFHASRRDQYTLIWLVQVIGEACTKVPKDIQAASPDIPWRAIIGMRHRIVHGYFDVNLDIVWNVVINRLPGMIPKVKAILAALPDEPG